VVFVVDVFVIVTVVIIIVVVVVVVDNEDGMNFDPYSPFFLPPLATSPTSTPCFCAMKPSTEKMTNPP